MKRKVNSCLTAALVLLAACELRAQTTGGLDLDTGLVAHWKLDECRGRIARDASGSRNHGILRDIKRPSGWVKGCASLRPNRCALSFDGRDDCVEVRHSKSLDTPDALSIACWVRLDRIKNVREDHTFVGKWGPGRDGTGESFIFWVGESAAHDELCFWASAGPWSTHAGTQISYTTDADLTAETWYHLAVVWAANRAPAFYKNGVALTSAQKGGPYKRVIPRIQSTATPIKLAQGDRLPPRGVHRLEGRLDDVRIYNRPLSPEEIAALATGRAAGEGR